MTTIVYNPCPFRFYLRDVEPERSVNRHVSGTRVCVSRVALQEQIMHITEHSAVRLAKSALVEHVSTVREAGPTCMGILSQVPWKEVKHVPA